MSFETLSNALTTQQKFSDLFFSPGELSDKEKEEITKTFVLSIHAAASELASSINYKDHRQTQHEINRTKIIFKSVDLFRYLLATLNLWEVDPADFVEACQAKDNFLHVRHSLESKKRPEGQKVVVFDCDDVIAGFRDRFNEWLFETKGIETDPNSTEYYNTAGVKSVGMEPEAIFREFIDQKGFQQLEPDNDVIAVMNNLKNEGYWIQILTARPSDNLRCYYDTYLWLNKWNVPFDAIGCSGEKFRWLADQDYYNEGSIVCMIDDSPKHSAELAKHGIRVVVPELPYNQEVQGKENVDRHSFKKLGIPGLMELIKNG